MLNCSFLYVCRQFVVCVSHKHAGVVKFQQQENKKNKPKAHFTALLLFLGHSRIDTANSQLHSKSLFTKCTLYCLSCRYFNHCGSLLSTFVTLLSCFISCNEIIVWFFLLLLFLFFCFFLKSVRHCWVSSLFSSSTNRIRSQHHMWLNSDGNGNYSNFWNEHSVNQK